MPAFPATGFWLDIGTAGDDGNRAGIERAEMRSGIDSAGHSRDHDDACFAQPGGKLAREAAAIGRGVAGADHRDHRREQHFRVAEHGQCRRRVLHRNQGRRVVRLAPADQPCAEPVERGKLGFGRTATHCGNRPGEPRHRVECGGGRAEAAQQRVKRDRPHRLGAAEA